MGFLTVLRGLGEKLGPYLIVELLLPGGSLLALLLFLHEHKRKPALGEGAPCAGLDFKRALTGLVDQCRLALQPCRVRPSRTINSIRRER